MPTLQRFPGDPIAIDDFSRIADPGTHVDDPWADEYRTDDYLAATIEELKRRHGDPDQPMGVYFLDGRDPRSSLGRAVELERFGDSFDNDVPMMRRLYGGFEQAGVTEMICVVDHTKGRPAGVIRTVRNTAEHGCRILNDLQSDGPDGWGLSWDDVVARSRFNATRPEEIIDIPTVAVAHDYAGSRRADGVSKALCAAVFQAALRSDAQTWVCSLDRVPYQLIQAYTADVFEEFDGVDGQPYYGATDTVPLWCNFRDHERYLIAERPDVYAWTGKSIGLEEYFFGWPETLVEVIDITDTAQEVNRVRS